MTICWNSFYFVVSILVFKWILFLSWAEIVLKTPYWVLLSTKFIIRFRRLCYSGKQQEPLNLVTQMASTCRTEQYFRLEALLAYIRGRLGFKYISLPVWRKGTDCNNSKGREIYFWRIHQFTMGYVKNEIRYNTSTFSTSLYIRLKKYRKMDKNTWNKFAIITHAQLLWFFPHPTNNVRCLYPEFFPNYNFCKPVGEGELQGIFLEVVLFWGHQEITKIYELHHCPKELCLGLERRYMNPALICVEKGCIFSQKKSADTTGRPSSLRGIQRLFS